MATTPDGDETMRDSTMLPDVETPETSPFVANVEARFPGAYMSGPWRLLSGEFQIRTIK
jgi:hypothetical protein